MSTSFQSLGVLQFSSLGLTTTLNGITLTQTLVDSLTGSTTSTSYVPTSLNFVLSSDLSQTITGGSYQTFTSAVLSLTTQSTRIVEISLVPMISNGYVEVNNPDFKNTVGLFRVLRGPSTIIGEVELLCEDTVSNDDFLMRVPASSFKFTDFSPLSGSATYIMQGNATGANTNIVLNGTKMFVRQL